MFSSSSNVVASPYISFKASYGFSIFSVISAKTRARTTALPISGAVSESRGFWNIWEIDLKAMSGVAAVPTASNEAMSIFLFMKKPFDRACECGVIIIKSMIRVVEGDWDVKNKVKMRVLFDAR